MVCEEICEVCIYFRIIYKVIRLLMNMKEKFAIWSWILPLVGFISFFLVEAISGNDYSRFGMVFIFILVFAVLSLIGLIFGIISVRRIKQDSMLEGKGHAIFGIVLGGIFFCIGLLGIFSGLFA